MSTTQPLQSFLDELASESPAPGGGSAAAAAGAMAAALVSMVCRLTTGKEKFSAVEPHMQEMLARSEALRIKLTGLMAEDVAAFQAVMAAYRLPQDTPDHKTARGAAIQTAAKTAALIPLATARACAEVIELAQPAAELGNPNVLSDAGVAALCAQAGLQGAALNVLINLGMIKDQTFVSECRTELAQLLTGQAALADRIYEAVKGKL
ncbi:MAG: methenyltetrahydrofolate cyclohydrolase [Chloroflexota bacterium]